MKRLFTSLLVLCLLLSSIAAMNVSAITNGGVVHYLTDKGSTIEVVVKVKGPIDNVGGFTMYTAYDKTKVAYASGNTISDGELTGWTLGAFKDYPTKTPAFVNYAATVGMDDTLRFSLAAGEETTIATFVFNKLTADAATVNTIYHSSTGVKPVSPTVYSKINTTSGDLVAGGTGGTPAAFTTEITAPPVNTITANITGKGKVFIDTVPYAGKVTLAEGVSTAAIKIIPNLGYKVETATLTDGSTGNIVGATGGTYNASGLSGDETLVVTFVPVAETIGANKPLPSQKVFKETKDVGGKVKQANTTFAAAPSTGIVECGIYLEKDGAAYTKFGGPYFTSNNTNENGQYGIEFVGFESGSYTATPYVKYTSATETPTLAGTSVTFVVE